MSEMVERVAKAICSVTNGFTWDDDECDYRDGFRREARAAIEAMREPTIPMEAASGAAHWRAMIDAVLAD